ncbi:hypothetical protein HMPREF1092_03198 [Clostridium thermobutyricum]|uniref:Uncharacterized protein n=2 Tax=Clostridium thermobutyricum TaxID=29372 RepID=N9XIC7_9CLOT|nr:hypothetical protein [Clostridium thermobutyricum]ENY99457.1 hypothetical protein HMPREF1092_03198 [Clostridium thermobutyricum]
MKNYRVIVGTKKLRMFYELEINKSMNKVLEEVNKLYREETKDAIEIRIELTNKFRKKVNFKENNFEEYKLNYLKDIDDLNTMLKITFLNLFELELNKLKELIEIIDIKFSSTLLAYRNQEYLKSYTIKTINNFIKELNKLLYSKLDKVSFENKVIREQININDKNKYEDFYLHNLVI